MARHWHWRRWRYEGWLIPTSLLEKIHANGFVVTLSRKCTLCDHVQFAMRHRDYPRSPARMAPADTIDEAYKYVGGTF